MIDPAQYGIPNDSYHPTCTRCPLHKKVLHHVGIGGNGPENADILVVAETPYKNEDRDNIALHPEAAAGGSLRQICDTITAETGVTFRYTNVMRCACYKFEEDKVLPRAPTAKEIAACVPWLREEIESVKPKVIVLAGGTALKTFFGAGARISDMRGQPAWRDGVVYVPMYHPSNMASSSHKAAARTYTPEQYREMCMADLLTATNIVLGEVKQPDEVSYFITQSEEQAMNALMSMRHAKAIAVDFETNSYQDTAIDTIYKPGFQIFCVGLCCKPREAVVIPLQCCNELLGPSFKPDYPWQEKFIHALWAMKAKFRGQNFEYDIVSAHLRYGVPLDHPFDDVLKMHHLLWSHRPHSLDYLSGVYTPFAGYVNEVKSAVAAIRPSSSRGYHNVPFPIVAKKNAYDAAITFELVDLFRPMIQNDPPNENGLNLEWIYNNVTIPVTNPIMQMSLRGLRFNEAMASNLLVDNRIRLMKLERVMAKTKAWQGFTPLARCLPDMNNNRHRAAMLFATECGNLIPDKVSTKTGFPTTDKLVLQQLIENGSDLAYGIREIRTLQGIETKTLKPLPSWPGWDGRVHPTYHITGTRTGRLAAREPNVLNQQSRVLALIEAEKGRKIIVGDISQAEVKITTIVCQVKMFLEAYLSGVGPDGEPMDIHAYVGSSMFEKSYEQVRKDEDLRRQVKGLVFGLEFGMTEYGLSAQINKPKDYCKKLIKDYLAVVPEIWDELFIHTGEMLIRDKFVRNMFGRYWKVSDEQEAMMNDVLKRGMKDPWEHMGMAEMRRQAANFRIQSVAAEIVYQSLLKFTRRATELGWLRPDCIIHGSNGFCPEVPVYMMNEIYDSIVIEVLDEYVEQAGSLLKYCMENPDLPFTLGIPWTADVKYGDTMNKDKHAENRLKTLEVPEWKEKLILV